MAILDSDKVDFLWKRIIFGVTKTAGALVKFGSNETIPSPLPVLPSSVWKDGDSIPATPPGSSSSPVTNYTGSARFQLSGDPTAPANQTWIATTTHNDLTTRQKDFIPPTFGSGYAAKVYIGDPNGGPAARIFPDTSGEEWVYDYSAGVLNFVNSIPANKAATVGSGTVSVSGNGIYVEAYRYTGTKGVGGNVPFIPHRLGELDDVETGTGTPAENDVLVYRDGVWQPDPLPVGTLAFQDANAINVSGGTLANVILTNVTIDGGTF